MLRQTLLSLLFCLVIAPTFAHAYIDPASGSYILQIIVGSVLAGLVTLKVAWHRILGFFRKSAPETDTENDAGQDNSK